MLEINNLSVSVGGKEIVKGVSLTIRPGEIHALMGPNGSGKSSLAMALAGHPRYQLKVKSEKLKVRQTNSKIELDGIELTDKTPDERARLGLFLALQYPVGIEGVTVEQLLRASVIPTEVEGSSEAIEVGPAPAGLDSSASERNISPAAKLYVPSLGMTRPLDVLQFRKQLEKLAKKVGIKPELLRRSINVGFSGGEKKRLEILQMLVLQPKYAILDETDSGLDVDALRTIATSVRLFANSEFAARSTECVARSRELRATSYEPPAVLVITHYARLLHHLKPDFVHVMRDGKITASGGKELAERIERNGYNG